MKNLKEIWRKTSGLAVAGAFAFWLANSHQQLDRGFALSVNPFKSAHGDLDDGLNRGAQQ